MTQLETPSPTIAPPVRVDPPSTPPRASRDWRPLAATAGAIAAYGLFWGWNAVFVAFVLLGFAPMVLPNLIASTWQGNTPPVFLALAVVLGLIPVLAIVIGWTHFRGDPRRLFALGYGVEGPAMILAAISLFGMREMNVAAASMFVVAGLGQLTLLWVLLVPRTRALAPLRAAGLTLMAVVGVYTAVFLAFYALPLAAQFGRLVADALGNLARQPLDFWTDPTRLLSAPFLVLSLVLLVFSASLFVLMPVVVPYLYVSAWWRGTRRLARSSLGIQAVVAVGLIALVALLIRQPQTEAFALLSTPPTTPAEAQVLRDREALVRDGLRNAYLAPMRYVSSVGDVAHIHEMYSSSFGLSDDAARGVQNVYEWVIRPFLYMPMDPSTPASSAPGRGRGADSFTTESARAAALYRAVFDEPILDGEREAVVRAVRSTWDPNIAAQSRREVEDREIRLVRQELRVQEHGDWAELELYEVYQNLTRERQEVVYYFNLPESAVITGVWLGESSERDRRFQYQVSPRGAAQQMYRTEVRRSVDPALVEQIGPRQYRLRVFPIEATRPDLDGGPPVHMWLTWRVLASPNGWALPRLAEKRNVFWDSATQRSLPGRHAADDWLPATVPATSVAPPRPRQVTFPNGEIVVIRPLDASASEPVPIAPARRFAVVLDRSRSMARHAESVRATLQRLRSVADADVFLTTSTYRGEAATRVRLADLDLNTLDYVGGQQASELLGQFEALRAGERYAAAIVLTDGQGFDLGVAPAALPPFEFPIWMVHVADELPLGYDDGTLTAIQSSGGGIAGSIDEFVSPFQFEAATLTRLVDGYTWTTTQVSAPDAVPVLPSDPFAAFAARHLILDHLARQRDALAQTATLDGLHAIALTHGIVTPYSSMIVLVTTEQQRRLAELERQGDRFAREGEGAGETVPASLTNVTAVPEPHEWLLMGVGVLILGAWLRRNRHTLLTRLQPRRLH